jgi:thioredoxin-related protein
MIIVKKCVVLIVFLFDLILVQSQDLSTFKVYKPEENAEQGIAMAVQEAKSSNKNVLIQVGGNWCIWCARFHGFVKDNPSLDSSMHSGFVVYHLNFSDENHNAKLLAKYRYPQRFGFPVFLILDANGDLIHTQNSGYLEEGKSYSKEKIAGFFADWSTAALDPKLYGEQ